MNDFSVQISIVGPNGYDRYACEIMDIGYADKVLVVNCDELQKQLAQAESDRKVLAAEVQANRAVSSMADDGDSHGMQWDRSQVMQWNLACKSRRVAIEVTDTSGALDRAK
jgi:hypothetical protein